MRVKAEHIVFNSTLDKRLKKTNKNTEAEELDTFKGNNLVQRATDYVNGIASISTQGAVRTSTDHVGSRSLSRTLRAT